MTNARQAGEPPDPPAARRLRARLRAPSFARAVWLQGVQGEPLARARARASTARRRRRPAGRGTIFDRTGVQLAIGEQTTTVFADPQQIRNPAAVANAAHEVLGVDANALFPKLRDKSTQLRLRAALRRPAQAALLEKQGSPASASTPEERRTYPQGKVGAQVIGYAGIDNKGLTGLEVQYDRKLSGRPGSRTIVRDGRGRAIDVIKSLPEQKGARRLHDARPHDPGAGRGGAPRDGRGLGREGGDRDRARPEDGRGARDGAGAGLRRERYGRQRPRGAAAQPHRHRHRTSPARRSSS